MLLSMFLSLCRARERDGGVGAWSEGAVRFSSSAEDDCPGRGVIPWRGWARRRAGVSFCTALVPLSEPPSLLVDGPLPAAALLVCLPVPCRPAPSLQPAGLASFTDYNARLLHKRPLHLTRVHRL